MYVLNDEHVSLTVLRMTQLHQQYIVVEPSEFTKDTLPTCEIEDVEVLGPFITSVRGSYTIGPLGAWGGRTYVLNLFFVSIPLWGSTDFQS